MKKYYPLIVMVIFSIFTLQTTAFAGPGNKAREYRMGTGKTTGNYFDMGNDIAEWCGNAITSTNPENTLTIMEELNGSIGGIEGLSNKTYKMAIIQEDVLNFKKREAPNKYNTNVIQVLAGLHVETVYLLFPKNWRPEVEPEGFSFSSLKFWEDDDEPVRISVDMLQGQKVAAEGGAIVSAEALKAFLGVQFEVVSPAKNKNIPQLLVGGHPYKPVEELLKTGKYILVSIDAKTIKDRAPFYIEATASYAVNGKNYSAKTVGVQALLVGKVSRNAAKNADLRALAQCIDDHLEELADDDDTNPNWQSALDCRYNGIRSPWVWLPLN